MPYIFGALVVFNVALFAYFGLAPKTDVGTLDMVQTQLTHPIRYQNNSHNIPPLIGEK